MKIIDRYPRADVSRVRPICEDHISDAVLEQNAAWMDRLKKSGGIGEETLQKKMRRRVRFNIPEDQCQNYARYQIDGKWFCRKHAGYYVLDKLAEVSQP